MTKIFKNFDQILIEHDSKSEQLEKKSDSVEASFVQELLEFIAGIAQSGVYLDNIQDRRATQSILDYWINVVKRLTKQFDLAVDLAAFDIKYAPDLADSANPYPRVNAFYDSHFFYGREELINIVINKIRDGCRLILIVGEAGSGKTSLVFGGIIPRLRRGIEDLNSEEWLYSQVVIPSQVDLESLLNLFLSNSQSTKCVFIDQFEELFNEKKTFQSQSEYIYTILDFVKSGHVVILSLRSEFERHVEKFEVFYSYCQKGRVILAPMTKPDLLSIIENPSREVGLRFDAGIADDLAARFLGDSANLILLQLVLWRLWQLRERNRITRTTFESFRSDFSDLCEKYLEKLYLSSDFKRRRSIENCFICLIYYENQNDRILNIKRRRVKLTELRNDNSILEVLKFFIDNGICRVTGNGSQVEIIHDQFIQSWYRVLQWLHADLQRKQANNALQQRQHQLPKALVELPREYHSVNIPTYEISNDQWRLNLQKYEKCIDILHEFVLGLRENNRKMQ
ncbi:MAG: ATP-binding protein [Anaerolineae bacterium]|nr:ATP-binding protein [Anaerolineae bacterium]